MTKFRWFTPGKAQYELVRVEDPAIFTPPAIDYGTVLLADCFSRNGYYGACWIIKKDGKYMLDAGSNDTGKSWKSPDETYDTITQAVAKAEELWRPA